MRDNIIEHQETLDPWDLGYDLFGDLISNDPHISPAFVPSVALMSGSMDGAAEDYSEGFSAERCCLIVWGEPWNEGNWEVTPAFLRKWAWLLKGCAALVESSNRWRAKTGEGPLLLEVDLEPGTAMRDESTFVLKVRLCMPDWLFTC